MLLIGREKTVHHDINFLPWRAENLRFKSKRLLIILALSVIAIIFVSILLSNSLNSQIQMQEQNIAAMKAQLLTINTRRTESENLAKRRDELANKWQWLREQQIKRSHLIEIMNLVPELIPSQVYLDSINYQERKVIIKGRSENSDAVDMLLTNLHSSLLVDNVHFEFIEPNNPQSLSHHLFSLSFSLQSKALEKGV